MRLLLIVQLGLTLATAYLLAMLAAATTGRRRLARNGGAAPLNASPGDGAGPSLRFALLIPAHNEEAVLSATLAAVAKLDYPTGLLGVIVIADNCTDQTAAIARAAGVTVWERTDGWRRGKGHALAWALERLFRERPEAEAVALLDADCIPSPNLVAAMDGRLRAGEAAVQANYIVANPGESWSAGLRYAAFALMNTVRPLGKDELGLSAGLLGTGMAFRRGLLERHPWNAFSIVEDAEYHARLLLAGERVGFLPEASVSSSMPATLEQARSQHQRWESGRVQVARRWIPPLLATGLRQRDPRRLNAAVELLIPPQTLLMAANVVMGLVAALLWLLTGARRRQQGRRSGAGALPALSALTLAGQAVYVVGGMAVAGAPAATYRSLALAPVLVLWKLRLFAAVLTGGGPRDFVRTERGSGERGSGERGSGERGAGSGQ